MIANQYIAQAVPVVLCSGENGLDEVFEIVPLAHSSRYSPSCSPLACRLTINLLVYSQRQFAYFNQAIGEQHFELIGPRRYGPQLEEVVRSQRSLIDKFR